MVVIKKDFKMSNMDNNPNPNGRGKSEKQSIWTKETLGVVLILFSTLVLVCLITRGSVFSKPGEWVNTFFFGCFGYFAYLVLGLTVYYGLVCITGKRISLSKKIKIYGWLSVIALAFLLHVITMRNHVGGYGSYIVESYVKARAGGMATCSGGGFFVGMFAYLFSAILKNVGSYVVLSVLLALCIFLIVKTVREEKQGLVNSSRQVVSSTFVPNPQTVQNSLPNGVELQGEKDYPVDFAVPEQPSGRQKLFVAGARKDDFRARPKAKDGAQTSIKVDYTSGGLGVVSSAKPYSQSYTDDMQSKIDYIKTPSPINVEKTDYQKPVETPTRVSDYIKPQAPISNSAPAVEDTDKNSVNEIPLFEHDQPSIIKNDAESHAMRFSRFADMEETVLDSSDVTPAEIVRPLPQDQVEDENPEEVIDSVPFVDESVFENQEQVVEDDYIENVVEQPPVSSVTRERARSIFDISETKAEEETETESENPTTSFGGEDLGSASTRRRTYSFQEPEPQPEPEPEKPAKPAPPINREYFRPPFDLLQKYEKVPVGESEDHNANMETIKQTLSEFNINAEPQDFIQGPSITRYEIMMPAGVSVRKVLNYSDNLQMRLESKEGVRIQAPIPGKNLVGIEIANKNPEMVGLREVMELAASEGKSKPGSLMFALGKDVVGKPVTDNLAKGPHYLIAGSTGSGKSVCLNAMLVSLIMRYSPEELKLFLVDPKTVEFSAYKHLPHLMIDEIITSPKKAIEMLKWAHGEMERRFKVLNDCGAFVVDINGYNERVASDTVPKMPRIVIVIDELADLMQEGKKEIEREICAIAQKARAVGIHLVIATQRPSVDVITGTIKANLPSRIAFKVMSFIDSQTILSEAGAEKLLGNGDMLYKNAQMPGTERYQGAYITSVEVNNVVQYIIQNNEAYFDDELKEYLEKATNPQPEPEPTQGHVSGDNTEANDVFLKALWFAVNSGNISISSMQRRFGMGFSKAGGIMDKMDRMGFVSPSEGSNKPRKVLLSREEFVERFGEVPPENPSDLF